MKTNVICIVPVKNEAWILKHFIEGAQEWADVIIMGDHNSGDSTATIAGGYECVRLVSHDMGFDESARRKLLIDEARKIPGRRLIIAIDADEMLSANWNATPEWEQMLDSPAGTRFVLDWVELRPGLERYELSETFAAFVDDGTEYRSPPIHGVRLPITDGPRIKLRDIKLLHYIAIDPESMLSKHRWYKCLETLEFGTSSWDLCVRYQNATIEDDHPTLPVQEEWIRDYAWLDDYRSPAPRSDAECYWWDREVLSYFDRYGTDRFARLNIWNVDWNAKARASGMQGNYSDPRSRWQKILHRLIALSARPLRLNEHVAAKVFNRAVKPVIHRLGW